MIDARNAGISIIISNKVIKRKNTLKTTTMTTHDIATWPEPVTLKSKDIGKDAFHNLLDLFKNARENNATKINNFMKTHGLELDTVPCYKKHGKWAVAYGKNGGGRDSHGNEMGYYFLANFKDADVKALLQREYPVHATHVYTIGEIATIFDVQL